MNAHFAQPQYLWLLLLAVPALVAFFWWSWRVKQKLVRQFISPRLLGSLMVGVSRQREKLRLALVVAAVACIFLALARPQWGFVWEEAHQKGLDIVVAVDTSRSMLAQDTIPNRLERAKLAALDLLSQAHSDRLGLVAFAGTAFLQTPLTLDEAAFRQGVEALQVGIIPQGGTALSAAIHTALDAFEKGNDNHKVLVLMTDGEDHDVDTETMAAAKEAADAGMIIFTVGVGTPEGELLRVKDAQGNSTFVKDENGDVVKSRLNQTLLQQIATAAHGFYLPLQGPNPMKVLYDRGLAPLPKSTGTTKLTRVYQERYHWPLALAMLCLIIEAILPESPRNAAPRRRKASAVAPPAVAALFLFLTVSRSAASPSSAYSDYQKGNYDSALSEYSRLSDAKTNDYRLHYDAGAAAYQTRQYQKALEQFNNALASPAISPDLQTQERAYFNMGNTYYHLGEPSSEPDQKQHQWEQAIDSYGRALRLNTNDIDARNNLAYVKQKLEQLKQQQQQKQDNNKNGKDKNQDQKQQQQQKNQQQKNQQNQNKDQQKDQDQKNKDQQQQQAQNDKQKQDEQKNAQQKQQQDQQAKQEQAQQDKARKDKDAEANASDQREKSQQNPQQAGTMMAQMTPEQARQLLDAQRDDEKALIFQPTNMPPPPPNVSAKDW